MKKLLSLVLVLAMAVIANAAFIAELSGDNTPGEGAVTLNVSDVGGLDTMMVITIQGAGVLTSSLGASAPIDSELVCTMADLYAEQDTFGIAGNGDLWTMTSYASSYPTGVWITANYSGAVAGDILTAYVTLDGENYTTLGSIVIVPEPATIALLCLGGLLLRKK
jgi:hypothetical protein